MDGRNPPRFLSPPLPLDGWRSRPHPGLRRAAGNLHRGTIKFAVSESYSHSLAEGVKVPQTKEFNSLKWLTHENSVAEFQCISTSVANQYDVSGAAFRHDPISIIVSEVTGRTGYYKANLLGNSTPICVSRTPLLSAARVLFSMGCRPSMKLVMRHDGSKTISLRSTIATAAALTVEETKFGPRFRPLTPISTLEASPRKRQNRRTATTLAEHASNRSGGPQGLAGLNPQNLNSADAGAC
jgi:hypothetical protein